MSSERQLKLCGLCKNEIPFLRFAKDKSARDGMQGRCRDCQKAERAKNAHAQKKYQKNYYEINKAHINARTKVSTKKWREANLDRDLNNCRKYRAENPEKIASLRKAYKERFPEKAAEYARKNRAKCTERWQKREAKKINATPRWANHEAILAKYKEAERLSEESGVKMNVDHIYPLVSDFVCGLHCEDNLQILTETANKRKGNKMPVVMTLDP